MPTSETPHALCCRIREDETHLRTRLEGRPCDEARFQSGYVSEAPSMRVQDRTRPEALNAAAGISGRRSRGQARRRPRKCFTPVSAPARACPARHDTIRRRDGCLTSAARAPAEQFCSKPASVGRCRSAPDRLNEPYAPVAQLDRALPSEGKGHTFESCRVRQALMSGQSWTHALLLG
jgi:hypothetical protein